MNPTLKSALEYASRGWAVFPLKAGTKVPATKHGCKDATTDPFVIEGWWEVWPEAGVGIATGSASGLVVLDFDKKHGGLETLDELQPDLPVTYTVQTQGGGVHLYFSSTDNGVKNKAGILPGMDVRGEGGYVVAPPTPGYTVVYASGAPSGLPFWLTERLRAKPQEPAALPVVDLPDGVRGKLNARTLRFIAQGAAPGTWHQELYQAAMNCKQNGYTEEECVELLMKATGVLDDSHDLPTIRDVYLNRTPEHPPELPEEQPEAEEDEEPLRVAAATLVDSMFEALADKEKVRGVSTGLGGLDEMLGGGRRLGELTVLMATAKTGKSSLYAYFIHNLLARGEGVGYASREMEKHSEVLPNLLSIEFGESVLKLFIDDKATEAHRAKYREAVASWPLHFAGGYGPISIEKLSEWMTSLRSEGVKYFFIDHLHYCVEDEEDWGKAVQMVRELRRLAIRLNVHVDLIVQPTKVPDGVKLGLNSLKGGSGIGQALYNLLLLETAGAPNVRKLTLDRSRFPLASPGSIYIQYDRQTRRYIEVEPTEEQPADPAPVAPRREFPRITLTREGTIPARISE
jgi:hypothetical protein